MRAISYHMALFSLFSSTKFKNLEYTDKKRRKVTIQKLRIRKIENRCKNMFMPIISVADAMITKVYSDGGMSYITINYKDEEGKEKAIELVLNERTIVLGMNGIPTSEAVLAEGMTVSATFSKNMTRSIPPQATAYIVVITAWPIQEEITRGIILKVDRANRSFILSNEEDFSSVIQFNVSDETMILNRFGRPIEFFGLNPGMRVQVRHANFTTNSIPPQTAAFEVRVL